LGTWLPSLLRDDRAARVLILCGGDKRIQVPDIAKARAYLADYKARTKKK